MNDKQRYYASLERQRTAEASLRSSDPTPRSTDTLEDLYADMGMRAFAAFQNCLDWVANFGRRSAEETRTPAQDPRAIGSTVPDLAGTLEGVKEQLSRLETAIGNLEAGLRRIDKYTLDAFRQLSELDATRAAADAQSESLVTHQSGRRLAKEEAIRLAMTAAQRMADAGQPLSLAAVAREAGLKYGQIVYAFGNKDNFLAQLEQVRSSAAPVGAEVAASEEHVTA